MNISAKTMARDVLLLMERPIEKPAQLFLAPWYADQGLGVRIAIPPGGLAYPLTVVRESWLKPMVDILQRRMSVAAVRKLPLELPDGGIVDGALERWNSNTVRVLVLDIPAGLFVPDLLASWCWVKEDYYNAFMDETAPTMVARCLAMDYEPCTPK